MHLSKHYRVTFIFTRNSPVTNVCTSQLPPTHLFLLVSIITSLPVATHHTHAHHLPSICQSFHLCQSCTRRHPPQQSLNTLFPITGVTITLSNLSLTHSLSLSHTLAIFLPHTHAHTHTYSSLNAPPAITL